MYNLDRPSSLQDGAADWSPNDPAFGTFGVMLSGLLLTAGLRRNLTIYRVLMSPLAAWRPAGVRTSALALDLMPFRASLV